MKISQHSHWSRISMAQEQKLMRTRITYKKMMASGGKKLSFRMLPKKKFILPIGFLCRINEQGKSEHLIMGSPIIKRAHFWILKKITARKRKAAGRPTPGECLSGSPLYPPAGRSRLGAVKRQLLKKCDTGSKRGVFWI